MRMDGGMPFYLQLSLPHSHFSAHEWGEGCTCVSICMHEAVPLIHGRASLPYADGREIQFIFPLDADELVEDQ